jgi:hypothetical protein
MRIDLPSESTGNVVTVTASGRLSKRDYEQLVPIVTEVIREKGKIRVLFDMDDFHGWTPGGLWEDIKFDVRHFNDIERIAIVGDAKWQAGMAAFCKPFTTAAVRFFAREQIDQARRWIADRE